jgi:hypothetical protein
MDDVGIYFFTKRISQYPNYFFLKRKLSSSKVSNIHLAFQSHTCSIACICMEDVSKDADKQKTLCHVPDQGDQMCFLGKELPNAVQKIAQCT